MYNGITLITQHVINNLLAHVVRNGSIYRTGVVLKTETNLYFYRMWCGITPKTTIPYQTHSPSISWYYNLKSTKLVYSHTGTKTSGMDTVLNKYNTSNLRQSPEDTSSIFLWNTAPQTTYYFNLDFLHHWKTRSKELQNISDNSVDGSCWENWMTSTTLFSLPTQYLMLQCFVPLLSDSFFYFPNCKKKGKRYNKIKPLGHSEMWNM